MTTLCTLHEWMPFIQTHILPVLTPGTVLLLSGPLGAGKTTFVQVLVQALGGTVQVKSPTFALMRAYSVDHTQLKRVLHIDAYRLESPEDARVLNLAEELEEAHTIVCIEWPERLTKELFLEATQVLRLEIVPQVDGARLLRW